MALCEKRNPRKSQIVRVNETILNENIRRTGVIQIAANVADNFRVHNVHVFVFAEKFSGRDVSRFLGLGFFDRLAHILFGFLFFFVSGSGLSVGTKRDELDVDFRLGLS